MKKNPITIATAVVLGILLFFMLFTLDRKSVV